MNPVGKMVALLSRTRSGLTVMPVALLLWSGAAGAAAPTAEPKRVLILESYGRDISPWNAIAPAFKNELVRQMRAPVGFHEAALETAGENESQAESAFAGYLRALYLRRQPDLVVPVGAAATQFWWRHRAALFPATPVVIGGIEQRLLEALTLSSNDTAVAIHFDDARAGLDLILRVLPATTNLAVVVGNSTLERFWTAECERTWGPYSNRCRLAWFNTLPFPEMCRRAAQLPPRSAVAYGMLWVDAAGVPQEQMRALDAICAVANAPVFGLFEEQLGHGIVGGRLFSSESIGREAAGVARRVLEGEAAGKISPRLLSAGEPTFDWRELQRWEIDERLLPAGSMVRFRRLSLWLRYRWYILAALGIITAQGATIIGLVLQRARRHRAEASAYEIGGRLITAQEEERRRIARDLHDDLNQRLALLSVELDLAGRAGVQAGLRAKLEEMADQVKELSSEVHKLSYQLHPAKLDQLGLVAAARTLCNELSAQSGLRIDFTHQDVPRRLPAEVALCLYRVLQEALGNAIRHSHATQAQANLRLAHHRLHLTVADNGAGFDPGRVRRNGGLGLLSMEERAHLVHGEVAIRAAPGRGTQVELKVPVEPEAPVAKGGP